MSRFAGFNFTHVHVSVNIVLSYLMSYG
ncbi:hypothetical protein MASSI9I_90193 [Massilia sp. 9I]|nr:hypothetical protein MASSI9I_90193 [Massilia sp. 9I]